MYTPLDETMLQLGLYDYVWGDNSMLQNYLSRVEAEKNRESQREYNEYLKEYDRQKAEAEEAARKSQELKEAEVELASLNRDLIKARPTEAAVIRKRQAALFSKYPELSKDDSVEQAYADEQKYKQAKIAAQRALPTTFATDKDIDTAIASIADNAALLDEDKEDIIKDLQSKKSTAQLAREASQTAVASHSGKKTSESLTDADLTKQALDAVKNNTSPSKLSKEVKLKLFALNYSYSSGKWALKEGAK